MAETLLDVANLALSRLGTKLLDSLDSSQPSAPTIALSVRQARKYVAELHSWKSLTDFAVLSPSLEKPEFLYEHKYLLPADCLLLSRVYYGYETRFKLQGRYILSDASDSLYISFIRDTGEDMSSYPAFLIDLIARRVEIDLSYMIKKDNALRRTAYDIFQSELQDAYYKDDRSQSPGMFDISAWTNARFYNGYGIYQDGQAFNRTFSQGELVLLYAYQS